jgi:hypothetical protein
MRRLFAETFAVPLLDAGDGEPEMHYDEQRQLNVTVNGRPVIEFAGDEQSPHLETTTKVRGESDDFARDALLLATETRQLPGERDDFARGEMALGTETAVGREADDFGRRHLGSATKTSLRAALQAPREHASSR